MNDVLEEFFLRVAFADGFPADVGEAGVLELGGGDFGVRGVSPAFHCGVAAFFGSSRVGRQRSKSGCAANQSDADTQHSKVRSGW